MRALTPSLPLTDQYFRFVCGDLGIYQAVDHDCLQTDPRRIGKPDGSWLPKVGPAFPGAISFWTKHGLNRYLSSGLRDWHESVVAAPVEILLGTKPRKILYQDDFQILCLPDDIETSRLPPNELERIPNPPPSVTPWRALERKIYAHSRFRKIENVLFELPDGRKEIFSLNHFGKVVCVLALTTDQQVVLARQFRPGPNCVLDELPGGGVEGDENIESAVRRELAEETGYEPGHLVYLGRFYECAYSTIERHAFLALECERNWQQRLDRNEFVEVVLKPIPDFMEQIANGLCTDSEVAWAGLLKAGLLQRVNVSAKAFP